MDDGTDVFCTLMKDQIPPNFDDQVIVYNIGEDCWEIIDKTKVRFFDII